MRAVVEAAGIKDVLAKSLGSNNPVNVVRATLKALEELESPNAIAQREVGRRSFAETGVNALPPIRPQRWRQRRRLGVANSPSRPEE